MPTKCWYLILLFSALNIVEVRAFELQHADRSANGNPRDLAKQGRDLFEEKCRTTATERIYKKVENVDGISLLKIRPARSDADLRNPMWPGAAFAQEFRETEYIKSFLWYEHSSAPSGEPVSPRRRGYLNTTPSDLPGYRYVDVVDPHDRKIYRYKLNYVPRENSIVKAMDSKLEKSLVATAKPTRYGVTFEDHIDPKERALWVASSTVKVIDLQTNEVLGETIRYSWAAGSPTPSNPVPWLSARQCPRSSGVFSRTRQFVDQILIPTKTK